MKYILYCLIILILCFSLFLSSNLNADGFGSDKVNNGWLNFDSLSVQDSTKIDASGRVKFYQQNTSSLIDFLNTPNDGQALIKLHSSYYLDRSGRAYLSFVKSQLVQAQNIYNLSSALKIYSRDGYDLQIMPGNLGTGGDGDLIFRCDDNNSIFFQDSSATNLISVILDGTDIGWYSVQGFPYKDLTDTTRYFVWGSNGLYLYSNFLIMNGDTLIGMDATNTDTFMIYDDGDTTRLVSKNPIQIGNNSLTINTDGSIVATGDLTGATLYGDGSNLLNIGAAAASALTIVGKERNISAITKGQVVYISGAVGGNTQIGLASNVDSTKIRVIGVAAENIGKNNSGLIRHRGILTNVDTRASNTDINPLGETWLAGDLLYLINGGTGGMSHTKPDSGRIIKVAYSLSGSAILDDLLVIPHENPAFISCADGEDIVLRMGDTDGLSSVCFKDYNNNKVGCVDSDGNMDLVGDIEGSDINATDTLKLNGTDINTAGTLTNIAYESQVNIFTENQVIAGGDTLIFIDSSGADSSLIYDDGTDLVIDVQPTGQLKINTAFVSNWVSITADSDSVDVQSANSIMVMTNAVTIGGFMNGIVGQIIHIINTSANNLILENEEATGIQDIITGTGADVTITGYGGATLLYDDKHWYITGIQQ